MGALYRVCSVLVAIGITAIAAASAAEPSFRYCEGGYVLERFASQESASRRNVTGSAGTITTFGSLEDGQGYAVQCKLEFFKSVYLYGGFSSTSPDETSGITTDLRSLGGGVSTQSRMFNDTSMKRWQVGFGYSKSIGDTVSFYGQVGAGRANYDSDGGVVFPAPAFGTPFVLNPRPERRLSVDSEVGIRWLPLSVVEVGAFVRYDGAGGLRVPGNRNTLFAVTAVLEDDVLGGAAAAVNVIGPLWISARYEIGRTDRLFAGVRATF